MYVTVGDIAAKLGTSLTADQEAVINSYLGDSVDAYINQITGTSFGSDEEVEVYVDGSDSNMLVIPTMHTITAVAKVEEDGTETAVSVDDYRTYPQGQGSKIAIRHLNGQWEEGIENYKVSGMLGYEEVPADIRMVAAELIANGLNANVNNYKSEKVGDWSVTYSDIEKGLSPNSIAILDNYKRLSRSM